MTLVRDASVRARELGAALKAARSKVGFHGNEIAERLGWSTSKVSRMETGDRACGKLDVATYLAYCGVVGDELARLIDMAEEPDSGLWSQGLDEHVGDDLRTLVMLESSARTAHNYEPLAIPGLTQTEGYIRALFRAGGMVSQEAFDSLVYARLRRQRVLDRDDAPDFHFFVHENALRTQVGGPRVMHEQMLHLLLLGTQPNCRIRVAPRGVEPRTGFVGPFACYEQAEYRSVVYVEQLGASTFLDGPPVEMYQRVLASLATDALSEEESRSLLARLASDYDRPG
ncbi:helix-turn-helix domain-containing protein [Actinokineospora xionganensis]|uniref:Helix-turn-helix domain-containing protein n=1 Tax=Actinokineospora xionganensis TaxID=2684470 RepID=A0ABR7L8Y7_9PSEU|nr:helix-turn-helix transcriptional regulator [Actinokineospora xionganensis]MBC6448973.1 helix-turn-helix domain-containing protein [Actinokineospora xionganensis]